MMSMLPRFSQGGFIGFFRASLEVLVLTIEKGAFRLFSAVLAVLFEWYEYGSMEYFCDSSYVSYGRAFSCEKGVAFHGELELV